MQEDDIEVEDEKRRKALKRRLDALRLSNEALEKLWPRIQPIMRDKEGRPWFIKPVDPRRIAYTRNPKSIKPAPVDLKEIGRAKAYIKYGYYGLFKPSIAECLASLPTKLAADCSAFEIVGKSESAADLMEEQDAFDVGYQICIVAYYGR